MENGVPSQQQGQRTLAAIVVTDAVGFSARMSTDEELTLSLIQRDLRRMDALCQQFEGQVLKSTGDGLLMYFNSAVQAVRCTIAIQQELAHLNTTLSSDRVLLHRIGVHLGDVFFNQADVMGNGVNIAARLQTEANPGGICISQIVYDVVKSRLQLNATYVGPLHLKNIQDAVPAYQIDLHPQPKSPQADLAATPAVDAENIVINIGDRVGGRYTLQQLLGQGGFGRSYLAEDSQRFGELCVVKEFVPTNKQGQVLRKAIELFKREAKTLYQINHPQIPKFLACFTQARRLFIVQEYIDGVTYSELLRDRQHQGRSFSEGEVVQWLKNMLQVLDYLHRLKLVHRDISPDNIIYSRDRQVPVLIDFGLVNDALTQLWSSATTPPHAAASPASVVGKFGYSPPEQIRLGQCYPCSDFYALGVTAIVLLTGRYPKDLVDYHSLEWRWQSYVSLTPQLMQILNTMLKTQPRERYQTAQEILAELEHVPSLPTPALEVLADYSDRTRLPDLDPAFEFGSPGVSSAAGASVMSPEFLQQCRQELARYVGPIASVLVEDTLTQYPETTPQGLVELLASQISNADQASAFMSRIEIPDTTPVQSSAARHSGGASGPGKAISGSSAHKMDEAFLQRCQQALARYVGPIAGFLLDEILADHPQVNRRQLVELLAAEIADTQKAKEFQQQVWQRVS